MESIERRWARVMVAYSTSVGPGDVVAIVGGAAGEPLLRELYREVILAGGHPVLLVDLPELQGELLLHGDDAQLDFVSDLDRFAREEADVFLRVSAATNTRADSAVDPARETRFTQARSGLGAAMMARAASGELRWSLTLYPTPAYAQDADLATDEFADLMVKACKLDQDDPVAAWVDLRERQQRLIDWLDGRREIHLTGPGTDLRMSIEGRSWVNSDGRRNFPSGEIFTGPVEGSVEGTVRFSYPVVTKGREIADVRLRFEAGAVVEASASKGEEHLVQALDTDEGARRLGEFAFGTNMDLQRFTKTILLDEKIGGTVHMAVGAGYPDTGSVNRSAIHWDLICDLRRGGRVTVDGEPFLVDGRFMPHPLT